MRIAYVTYGNIDREGGVLKKILGQTSTWSSQGHDVKLFAFASRSAVWQGAASLAAEVIQKGSSWARPFRMKELVARVLAWQPDLVYFRFGLYYPPLSSLMIRIPTVVEVNTDDVIEYKTYLPAQKYLYHRLTRGRLLKKSSGLICVSRELVDRFRRYRKPITAIGNGIDLSQYPQLPSADNARPRLVFIGAPLGEWHGLDKIMSMAQMFPDWHFDIIGYTAEDVGGTAPANMTTHGPKSRDEYQELMARADVGIAALAFHRIGIGEGSPLKTREYLAFGIPVIAGYCDTDFPDSAPHLLTLPNIPGNVGEHRDEIERFVTAWRGKRVPRGSLQHLDTRHKEEQRLAFFQELLESKGATSQPPAGTRRSLDC